MITICDNVNTVEEMLTYLTTIENINYGGCGIAAISMYRWLLKNDSVDNSENLYFAYLYKRADKDRYLSNKKAIKTKGKKNIRVPNHIAICYNNTYIDCMGTINLKHYEWIQNIYDVDFVLKTINDSDEWNIRFNRQIVSKIENTLDIDLSDIKI
jgi:hypothetical protein